MSSATCPNCSQPGGRHVIHPGACPRAPLDPSKVKAGDTVEVRVDAEPPWTIAGTVTGGLGGGLWVGPAKVSTNGHWHDSATLTAHQPAPEPEPEWKPGTVAVVIPSMAGGKVVRSIRGHEGNWLNEFGGSWDDDEVIDVRPLVVIDPADVDVDALNTAALNAYMDDSSVMTADGVRAAVGAVLAQLGIEAP